MNATPRLFCNPIAHIRFSGGNYFKHFWFGWQSVCLSAIALIAGLLHIIFPFLFPFVADSLCIHLGKKCEEHHQSEAKRRRDLELRSRTTEAGRL